MLAAGERDYALLQTVVQMDVGGAGAGEIALVGVVGTLLVVDPLDQFRDQEVDVRVALAVGVATRVDRHARHIGGEVGAVIEIEAAQKILVGLAFAAVLGDDQSGDEFQHFAGAQYRAVLDQLCRYRALARRIGSADGIIVVAIDFDLFQLVLAVGMGRERKAR